MLISFLQLRTSTMSVGSTCRSSQNWLTPSASMMSSLGSVAETPSRYTDGRKQLEREGGMGVEAAGQWWCCLPLYFSNRSSSALRFVAGTENFEWLVV